MRCNACWKELEGRAVTTICGHLLCTEDASKILGSDASCPICDQVLSKSHMKPVDINPNDEWISIAMAGVTPQILMKSAYQSIMFYIGQRELEMQYKLSKIGGQCQQKCKSLEERFTEKMVQMQSAYQKIAKKCQLLEQENESLGKDKQELQEKFSEKSRQKRKLDEMYDRLKIEYELIKRPAIQPVNSFFPGGEHNVFPTMANTLKNENHLRQDRSLYTPGTPGQREDMWPQPRQRSSLSGPFDVSGGATVKSNSVFTNSRSEHPTFQSSANNPPALTLRSLILSPTGRPQQRQRSSLPGTFEVSGGTTVKSNSGPTNLKSGLPTFQSSANNHPAMSIKNHKLSPAGRSQIIRARPFTFT